nr:immunoglobulin heavy chain junction region [Macaca mulatta]
CARLEKDDYGYYTMGVNRFDVW